MGQPTGETVDDTLERAHEALAAYRAVSVERDLASEGAATYQAWREACEAAADRLGPEDLHALAGICIEEDLATDTHTIVCIDKAEGYLNRVINSPRVTPARRLRAAMEVANLGVYRGILGDGQSRFMAHDEMNDTALELTSELIGTGLAEECPEIVDMLTLSTLIMDRTPAHEVVICPPARIADHPEGWHLLWYDASRRQEKNLKLRIAVNGPSPFILIPPQLFNGGFDPGSTRTLQILRTYLNLPNNTKPKQRFRGTLQNAFQQVRVALRSQGKYQKMPEQPEEVVEAKGPSYAERVEWYLGIPPDEALPADDSVEEALTELGGRFEAGELEAHDTYMYGWMQLEFARASNLPADFEQAETILAAAAQQYEAAGELSYAYEARLARLAVPMYQALHTSPEVVNEALMAYHAGLAETGKEMLDNRKKISGTTHGPHVDMLLQQVTTQLLLANDDEHYYFMIPSPPRQTDRHALIFYWEEVDFTPTSHISAYIDMNTPPQRTELGRAVITPHILEQTDKGAQFNALRAALIRLRQRQAGKGGNAKRSNKDKLPDLWDRLETEIKRAADL
jgi:hypothetical protein